MWTLINQNSGAISIVLTVIAAIYTLGKMLTSFLSYMDLKKKEIHERRLNLYHDLVARLVSPGPSGSAPKLDSQIAIVYELCNFPEYYPVTNRILQGLKQTWTAPAAARLIDEINTAINTIGCKK